VFARTDVVVNAVDNGMHELLVEIEDDLRMTKA